MAAIQHMREIRDEEKKREEELVKRHIRNQDQYFYSRSFPMLGPHSMSARQTQGKKMLLSWKFDSFIGACICFNALTIGVESAHTSKELPPPLWVTVAEPLFLAAYTAELSLRVYVFRTAAFKSHWVKFDLFLVLCGFMDVFVRIALSGESPEVLANVMLVRMLRLARLARAARLLVQFKVLWLLVQGLMNSFLTIMWTFVIVFVLIYIFAILGLELMRPDDSAGEEYQEAALRFNEGLGYSMLVLVQFLTLDSIGGVYVPICVAKPWLVVYFASFILFVSVALMNLVTALMVDAAMSQSTQDKEAQRAWEAANRKRALPKLKAMFEELDEDGSGFLDIDEIKNAPDNVKEQLQQIANMEDCEELFHMLDYDGSGTVEVDEFCDGVLKVSAENKPLELLRITRQCNAIQRNSAEMLEMMQGSSSPAIRISEWPEKDGFGGAAQELPDGMMPGTTPPSDRGIAATVQELRKQMGDVQDSLSGMSSRITGLEQRFSGLEANIQRIADCMMMT